MTSPIRLRITRERTSVAGGRAAIIVARVECALTLLRWQAGFAMASPIGVSYTSASGYRFQPVIDISLAATAALLAALAILAWLRIRPRLTRPSILGRSRRDDF